MIKKFKNKYAVILIALILCSPCFAGLKSIIDPRISEGTVDNQILVWDDTAKSYAAKSQGNTLTIYTDDNIQDAYDWLKSSSRDAQMGTLSETNRRVLILPAGEYIMDYTVLLDTDYVDVRELVDDTVTITKSGNGMGITILPGVEAVNMVADDRVYVGRFSRNSIAHDKNDVEYGINDITKLPMAVSGIVTDTSELANEVSGNPLTVQYKAEGLATPTMFGNYSNLLRQSTDGINWTSTGISDGFTVVSMWDADDLGNCVCSAASSLQIWYGTFDGVDDYVFAKAQKDGGDFELSADATTNKFNFIRLASGTLILTEYSAPPKRGRYIYRSTDKGHTWSECYDAGLNEITHFHGAGELLETNRIVVVAGDSEERRMIVSDDDGLNWSILRADGVGIIQPIAFTDIGHPTKLLAGDDTNAGALLLDLYSGEATRVMFDTDGHNFHGFIWNFAKADGIIYASSLASGSAQTTRRPVIYATSDLVNWTVVYRIISTASGGTGYIEHFIDSVHGAFGGLAHIKLTPPSVSDRKGVAVEQAVTNDVPSEVRSSYEDANWANYIQTPSATSTIQVDITTADMDSIPHGDKAIRVTRTGLTQNVYTTFLNTAGRYGVDVLDTEKRMGSITIGVPKTGVPTLFSVKYVRGDGTEAKNATSAQDYPIIVVVQPGEWREVTLPEITIDGTLGGFDLYLGVSFTASVDVGTVDVLFDKSMVTDAGEQPSSWQVGGTPRASAVYDLNWNTAEKATHIFTFVPKGDSDDYDMLTGDLYIRSWRISAATHAELYYDADDQLFKLAIAIDGGDTDLLVSPAAVAFKKGQPLVFAIQFGDENDTNMHMSVGHGRVIDTTDGAAEDYSSTYGLADLLVRWGDEDAANGLNGSIYDIEMTGVMTTTDIVTYLDGKI